MFPKSSVLAVVALAAFVSLGALLFPQVVRAQDCLFDCFDLGSDPSFNPWGNSPATQLDIAYCFDRDCVLNLKDGNEDPIFTGNHIPTPHVKHDVEPTVNPVNCPASSNGPLTVTNGPFTVTISGNVVALLRDTSGDLIPGSQANATLFIKILGVTCSLIGGQPILSRLLTANPYLDPRTDVFDALSNITIGPGIPTAWGPSCPTGPTAVCSFPLGIEDSALKGELPATTTGPVVNRFQVGEVYRAVPSTKFVGVRDCKGDPSAGPYNPITGPSTIECSVGGGESQALETFDGNWAGAENKKINPKSGTGQFDIITPLFASILPDTVTASANNGPEVPAEKCDDKPSQNRERCFFAARDLLPNGCTKGAAVEILVRGKLDNGFRFASRDNPICN